MKKWIFLFFLAFLGMPWLYYSNPAKNRFSTKSYRSAPLVTTVDEIWRQDSLQNRPIWLMGYVSNSISTKYAGYFVLENDQSDLLVLSRGMTPRQGQLVYILLIPREVIMIQNRELLVGALIHYSYVEEERPKENPIPESKHL